MIKFVNETGLSRDTQIIDGATGEKITDSLAIEYGAQITIERDMVKATCRIAMMSLNVTALKVEFQTYNPTTGKYQAVKAIEFADGTRIDVRDDMAPIVRAPSDAEDAA